MSNNSTLGRGLESLIPLKKINKNIIPQDSPVIEDDVERVIQIPVEKIKPNPHQPRQEFDPEELSDLATSIKEYGILQPLIATSIGDEYQLIAGERRLRAAKIIGLKVVPAIIRKLQEHQKLELALIENIQRKNLNPIEQAVAFRRLIDEFNFTHDEMAKRLGKSRPYITNALRLLNLSEEIQKAIIEGKINFTVGRTLSSMSTDKQKEIFDQVIKEGMKTGDVNVHTRKIKVRTHIRTAGKDPNILAKEKELEEALGTRVVIKKSGDSGQIVIDFYSEEDLAGIIGRLKA